MATHAPMATPRVLFVSAFDTVRVSKSNGARPAALGILGSSRHLSSYGPIPTASIPHQSRPLHAMSVTSAGLVPISRLSRGYVSHSGRTCRRFSTVKGDSDSGVVQPSSPVRAARGDNNGKYNPVLVDISDCYSHFSSIRQHNTNLNMWNVSCRKPHLILWKAQDGDEAVWTRRHRDILGCLCYYAGWYFCGYYLRYRPCCLRNGSRVSS